MNFFHSIVFSHALLGPHEHAAILVASLGGVGHDAGSLGNADRDPSNLFVPWVLVAEDELPLTLVHHVAVLASPSGIHQVWPLTQFYSPYFSQSTIGVKKCILIKLAIKVCVGSF